MKCFNCNSEVADENTFCPLCGTILTPQQNNLESNNVENVPTNVVNEVQNPVVNPSITNEQINNNVEVQSSVIPSIEQPVQMINNLDQVNMQQVKQNVENTNFVDPTMNISNNYNNSFQNLGTNQEKKKSKTPFIIALILIIVILGVAGVCAYLFMASPKKMFVSAIDNSYKFLSNVVDSKMYTSDTVSIDFDLKTTGKTVDDDMGPIFNIIKNISLSGKSQIDFKNKNVLVDLDSKYNNNELVNAGLYVSNEKLYFDLNDLYDKKLYYDVEGINEFFKINEYTTDVYNIVEEVKNIIASSLKNEYFKTEKVKMNVNGEESSVNKTILFLDYNNLKTLLNDCLNSLKSNEKFLDSYVNLMKLEEDEITNQDVIDQINDMLEEINEETEIPEGDIKIILYTKGFNKDFVGFAFEDNTSEYGQDFSIMNDKENIFTVKYNDGFDEQEAIIKVNGDIYTLVLDEDYTKMELSLNIKTYDISYKLISDEITMTGSSKTDKDGKININVLYEAEGNEIGIDMNYTIKYDETVTIPTLTPSVDIEFVTDEDGMSILNKLQEKQGVKDLMSEIERISSPLKQQQLCASAFGCDCGNNNETCTCSYVGQDGNVVGDTIECDNPNYQNCPSGINCLQSDNYNTYNEFSY